VDRGRSRDLQPFAHGTDTELADKFLAGETYSEAHYLRQAQRYLGHAVRALRGMGWPVTVATLTVLALIGDQDPAALDLHQR